ncbi:MAG: hypothetical protein H7A43_03080 [Verrucomicrobia bacterium]|nr:hypothetical protein [Verrucomicrobiota bacterium]
MTGIAVAEKPDASIRASIAEYHASLLGNGPIFTREYIESLRPIEKAEAMRAYVAQTNFSGWLTDFVAHSTWDSTGYEEMLVALQELSDTRIALLEANDPGCGNYLTAATISWAVCSKLLDGFHAYAESSRRSSIAMLTSHAVYPLVPDVKKLRRALLREKKDAPLGNSFLEQSLRLFGESAAATALGVDKDLIDSALAPQENRELNQHSLFRDMEDVTARSLFQRLIFVERIQALCVLSFASQSGSITQDVGVSIHERVQQLKRETVVLLGPMGAEVLIGSADLSDSEWVKRYTLAKSMVRDIRDYGGMSTQLSLRAYLGEQELLHPNSIVRQ